MRHLTTRSTRWFLGAAVALGLCLSAGAAVWASGNLTTQLSLKVATTGSSSSFGLSTVTDPVTKDYTQLLSSGTGSNQASNQFHDQRTLTASSSENLDLAGALTNGFGQTLTFTAIKAIIIHASSANTNNVVVGGAGSNGFTTWSTATDSTVSLPPNGTLILVNPGSGWSVTAGTGDLLKVANSGAGTSVVYDVILIGVD